MNVDEQRFCFCPRTTSNWPILLSGTWSPCIFRELQQEVKGGVGHILLSHPREDHARMKHPSHRSRIQYTRTGKSWATRHNETETTGFAPPRCDCNRLCAIKRKAKFLRHLGFEFKRKQVGIERCSHREYVQYPTHRTELSFKTNPCLCRRKTRYMGH